MMEAAHTSETSVDNHFTWQYIPKDKSELHTRRRENLKSHGEITHLTISRISRVFNFSATVFEPAIGLYKLT
jgi:hypothetical protein